MRSVKLLLHVEDAPVPDSGCFERLGEGGGPLRPHHGIGGAAGIRKGVRYVAAAPVAVAGNPARTDTVLAAGRRSRWFQWETPAGR